MREGYGGATALLTNIDQINQLRVLLFSDSGVVNH